MLCCLYYGNAMSQRSNEATIWLQLERNKMSNRALTDTREIPEWRQATIKDREEGCKEDRAGKPLRSWVSPKAWQQHFLIVASNPGWSRPDHSHWRRLLSHAVIKAIRRLDSYTHRPGPPTVFWSLEKMKSHKISLISIVSHRQHTEWCYLDVSP